MSDSRIPVQIARDNYDITHNPAVKRLYPALYEEVKCHDETNFSSWYSLTKEAHEEYLKYKDNDEITYVG